MDKRTKEKVYNEFCKYLANQENNLHIFVSTKTLAEIFKMKYSDEFANLIDEYCCEFHEKAKMIYNIPRVKDVIRDEFSLFSYMDKIRDENGTIVVISFCLNFGFNKIIKELNFEEFERIKITSRRYVYQDELSRKYMEEFYNLK